MSKLFDNIRRLQKLYVCLVFLFFLLFPLILNSPAQAARDTGFHIDLVNGKLLDANKEEFEARGINHMVSDYDKSDRNWYGNDHHISAATSPTGFFAADSISYIRKQGFNAVRLQWEMSVSVARLKTAINNAITQHMIPIVYLDDGKGSDDPAVLQQMAEFWRDFWTGLTSDEQTDYRRYLMINIANEWGTWDMDLNKDGKHDEDDRKAWANQYKTAVGTIRSSGYEGVLIIDAPGGGQQPEAIQEQGLNILNDDTVKNIMFSLHIYEDFQDNYDIGDILDDFEIKKIPVIIGEFGPRSTTDVVDVMKNAIMKGVGYIGWAWQGDATAPYGCCNTTLNVVQMIDDISGGGDNETCECHVDFRDLKGDHLTSWGNTLINNSTYGVAATAETCSVFRENAALFYPHVASDGHWETEICIINAGSKSITGVFKAYDNSGSSVSDDIEVSLSANARREITVGNEFINPSDIGYIIFETDSENVIGYTKFYIDGQYRVAVPAVSDITIGGLYISHIASTKKWWTGVSIVNTESTAKNLTIQFDDGSTKTVSLAGYEHKAFSIKSLFDNTPQTDFDSAIIKNADGVVGLELFGSTYQLSGILLKNDTTTDMYYPHIASNNKWWTGIVAYNPSASSCILTINPYTAEGTALTSKTINLSAYEKYIGNTKALGLPTNSEWFHIEATQPITGFELFGTNDSKLLAGYTGVNISGTDGIFAKIDKEGWTGIAFVNITNSSATVNLTAYDNSGKIIDTESISLAAYAKMVDNPKNIFSQDISNATYITYSSDHELVGFQLNGSSDGMMLDGLPGMNASGDQDDIVQSIASCNNIEAITEWLKDGGDVNMTSQAQDGKPLLVIASENGCLEAAELLIDYEADVNNIGDSCCTPLMAAAWEGHLKIVELLVKQKDINLDAISSSGLTALYFASAGVLACAETYNELYDLMDMLADKGADYKTLILLSIIGGPACSEEGAHLKIFDLLLDEGADPSIVPKSEV